MAHNTLLANLSLMARLPAMEHLPQTEHLPAIAQQSAMVQLHGLAQRSTIEEVEWSSARVASCRLFIKRDDLLHHAVSGNKLFKLFHHLHQAKNTAARGLISFGGAYSNHLYALARVAKALKLPSLGIIRGEEAACDNPTLHKLQGCGMHLVRLSREQYRRKMDPLFLAEIKTCYEDFYLIPEGGAGVLGAQGFADYADAVTAQLEKQNLHIDSVWLPAGTGTSVAGLAARWHNVHAVGALALQDPSAYKREIHSWTDKLCGARPIHPVKWHGFDGRFGRITASIIDICRSFYDQTGVLLDPIYGGKVLLALQKAFDQGLHNQHILLIHTGGNQGWRGVIERSPLVPPVICDALTQYFQDVPSFRLNDADLTLGIAANADN